MLRLRRIHPKRHWMRCAAVFHLASFKLEFFLLFGRVREQKNISSLKARHTCNSSSQWAARGLKGWTWKLRSEFMQKQGEEDVKGKRNNICVNLTIVSSEMRIKRAKKFIPKERCWRSDDKRLQTGKTAEPSSPLLASTFCIIAPFVMNIWPLGRLFSCVVLFFVWCEEFTWRFRSKHCCASLFRAAFAWARRTTCGLARNWKWSLAWDNSPLPPTVASFRRGN